MRCASLLLALVVLVPLIPARSRADSLPTFSAGAEARTDFVDAVTPGGFGPTPIPFQQVNTTDINPDPAIPSASAGAGAEPGRLAVAAETDAFPSALLFPFNHVRADAAASFRLTDLVFSGPASSVTTRDIYFLDGFVDARLDEGSVTVLGSIALQVPGANTIFFQGCTGAPVGQGGFGTVQRGGCAPQGPPPSSAPFALDFSNINHQTGFTPSYTVPTNVPIAFTQSIELHANGISIGDFESTFSFPLSGPVFDLPPGFTVNSAQGLIQDNRWLGAPTASPVPEPANSILMTLGIVCVVVAYAWQRRPASRAGSV